MGAGGSIHTFTGREDLLNELHVVASKNLPQLMRRNGVNDSNLDASNLEMKLPILIDQYPALLTNLCILLATHRNNTVSSVIL